ncbi:hypothetical protein [Pedobacter sp. Hv1]|uniref:hypothetical protein n=1 Tax=Pedobacter sp. Hv1 TaxID=1740090 RepID=UPI00128F00F8|nr:hypothetical protein [Pedobacter sp. Hv1]
MKPIKLIIKAALIVGTLDILAAFLNFYIQTGKNPSIVLKYIASAALGNTAAYDPTVVILLGLLFHFVIAFAFTILFSFICDKLWYWFKNGYVIAILYGILIWMVMNLLVVPNSLAPEIPFTWTKALLNCAILIVCIGFPLSYLFFQNKQANSHNN